MEGRGGMREGEKGRERERGRGEEREEKREKEMDGMTYLYM